ncbi:hypothetical protein [Bradyrhizobium sp. AT1]|uniref:hypothetical protein n=1 Tax=Bradyrhizobium sp. AT1 TaxID=574934 RepID=UPI0018DC2EE3|nr:hypothetical protein [Bradyrhizobium sp. AT1]
MKTSLLNRFILNETPQRGSKRWGFFVAPRAQVVYNRAKRRIDRRRSRAAPVSIHSLIKTAHDSGSQRRAERCHEACVRGANPICMARSRRIENEGGWRSVDDGLRPETDSSEAYQKGAGGQDVPEEDVPEEDVPEEDAPEEGAAEQSVAEQDVAKEEQSGAARCDLVFVAARGAGSPSAGAMETVRTQRYRFSRRERE